MTQEQQLWAPTLDDIRDAAAQLRGVITQTPLLESREVNKMLNGRLFIKAENLQRTGAFKIRGAYYRISQLSDVEKQRGTITYSSGNHAQGVALAAQILGTTALIVMPETTPAAKVAQVRGFGAQVVFFDRETEFPDDAVARVQAETGRIVTPPSEDRRVLAGGGTIALEMLEQSRAVVFDKVLMPCGSGGIAAATNIVMKNLSPQTNVILVEPDLFDDTKRSLAAGKRLENPKGRKTICDAIMTPMPNPTSFKINQKLGIEAVSVSDDQVRTAMLFAFEHYKTVIEPGAAVGLAAVLAGKADIKGQNVAVIATGGNVDVERFTDAITQARRYV